MNCGVVQDEACLAHKELAAPQKRIRVLVLIPSLDVGGVETDLVRILPLLDRQRFKVTVRTMQGSGTLAPLLLDAGIEVIGPIPSLSEQASSRAPANKMSAVISGMLARMFPKFASVWHWAKHARQVARDIRNNGIGIVHAVLPSAYLIGVLAVLCWERRPIVMSRVSLDFYQRGLWRVVERRFLHPNVDIAMANCHAIMEQLHAEGIPAPKIRLVYNGIDSGRFRALMTDRETARGMLGVRQGALVFTCVANLYPYKGHEDLLHALKDVRGSINGEWQLLAAGRDVGENMANLQKTAERLGLSDNVVFLGTRTDIPIILSAADIHISASHTEGFPNNILEAMCAGLAVVATAVGGVTEQIIDGQTGILVPPRDPKALAAAISGLIAQPDLRRRLGASAREEVERNFSIEKCVSAWNAIYSELGQDRRGSQPVGALARQQ